MSRGGPRNGAGRPEKSPDLVRDRGIRIMLTQSEYEVMEMLSEQWDVPIATAAYGLLADVINKCRRARSRAIPEKLILAASRIVAQSERAA